MSHWSDAGFGTDPEGDARRRAELESARVDDLDRLAATLSVPELPAGGPRGPSADLVILDDPLDDPHAVQRVEYPWGVAWTCACGGWEAVATGPSSAAWAGADHARHVRDRLDAEPGS